MIYFDNYTRLFAYAHDYERMDDAEVRNMLARDRHIAADPHGHIRRATDRGGAVGGVNGALGGALAGGALGTITNHPGGVLGGAAIGGVGGYFLGRSIGRSAGRSRGIDNVRLAKMDRAVRESQFRDGLSARRLHQEDELRRAQLDHYNRSRYQSNQPVVIVQR